MWLMQKFAFIVLFGFVGATELKIVFWIDPLQAGIDVDVASTVNEIQALNLDTQIQYSVVVIEEEETNKAQNMDKFCERLAMDGVSVVIDFTYHIWRDGLDLLRTYQIPFLRVERMLTPYLKMFSQFIMQKSGHECIMIFENSRDTEEAIIQIIEGYHFRTLVLNAFDERDFVQRVRQLRPTPSCYALFAGGTAMNTIFEKISKGKLFERPREWHFVYLDTRDRVFKFKKSVEYATKFTINPKTLCRALRMKDSYCLSGFTFQRAMILEILRGLIEIKQTNMYWLQSFAMECNGTSPNLETPTGFDILEQFPTSDFLHFTTDVSFPKDEFDHVPRLTYSPTININFYSSEHEAVTDLAIWENDELRKINQTISPPMRFFRIGTVESIPWNYLKRDPHTDELVLDAYGNTIWEGFCIDFIKTLSERLNFGYVLVPPTTGEFGRYDATNDRWDGIVGDLVTGETDFAVTALKMYSEREGVIDYIAPYFEQTGISIVMRKPVRQTSLFKFMTVLRVEVWFSIIAALVGSAIMIWLLDKYSPYSYRNNRAAYPYPCREFTLRESFWFALTSFTPQGGGEAPKAISGRIMVAAYWLFVVLMLATFTANLAAFLTVERMQAPVQSLEQLARQSRINYTVVEGSSTHQYFINMKFAEDTLYRMWKELTLNVSEDYQKYRIWDYPIKEQYGTILLAINGSEPVKDAKEGFRKVNEHENADFAFIHDSSEIKYELTRNCNLTEVGEVFAEQPYAIAIQQGSHFADELSYALLELQKDRFFEELKAKYWNTSRIKACSVNEEQEGISLESLGGVFIATLFGLGLAMVTLVLEIFYYRRKYSAMRRFNEITKVKPASTSSLKQLVQKKKPKKRIAIWHTAKRDNSAEHTTPPPAFDAIKFRGKKVPHSITLGGEEFKPRKGGLRRLSDSLDSVNYATKEGIPANRDDELPPYTE
ncbi:glutamate receptor ionotropic, kainate 2 [Anastrepha ludens]|uniref:glutamate receptor ionotropic, kainate 2 n=1 Tax=Anastrepha ludens TaxID=28586 RepID=UPI0023B1D922|nr:glutamate receptor ionotropic, kainate 2 [Anastrepha ludens]